MRPILCAALVAYTMFAQTKVSLRDQGVNPDFSAMAGTRPTATGGALPATCTVGELYFLTTAAAGKNLYACPATNVWILEGSITGPSEATINNGLVRWNGTTASELKDSVATIDDAGNAVFPGSVRSNNGSNSGCVMMQELSANGDHFRKLCADGALNENLEIDFPSGVPTVSGQVLTVSAPVGGRSQIGYASLANQTVQSEGSDLTGRPRINFSGSGVSCADNAGANPTDCAIAGDGIDVSVIREADEMCPSAMNVSGTVTGLYGKLNWLAFGGPPPVQTNVANQAGLLLPCLVELSSAATANSMFGIHLGGASFSSPWFYNAAGVTNWEFQFTIRTDSALGSQTILRVGLADSGNQRPDNGLWFRYANNSSCTNTGTDSGWVYEARQSGVSSTAASGVSASAGHVYRLRLRSGTVGTVLFSMADNGGELGTETAITTNLPVAALAPAFSVVSCDSSVHKLLVDRFDWRQTGLVR